MTCAAAAGTMSDVTYRTARIALLGIGSTRIVRFTLSNC